MSLLILLLSQSLFARLYGVSGYAYAGNEGRQTSDGGYIITGYSGPGSGDWDLLLLKLNSDGSVSWARLFGGSNDDAGKSLVISTDGGYAVAGHTLSYGAGNYDLFVLKVSSGGSFQWAKALGGTGGDKAQSIIQTTDGGYLVAGYAYISTNTQAVLVKLNSNGSFGWAKHYGGSNADLFTCVIRTADGGYAAVGVTLTSSRDVLVVKTSSDGSVQWAKAYGGSYEDLGLSIVQASDGTYYVAGSVFGLSGSGIYNADFLLMKLNTDGTIAWSKVLEQSGSVDTAVSVILLSDGSLLLAGKTTMGAGYRDILLAKFSSSGTLQGTATIGGTGWESWYEWEGSRAISPASDGRYLITGNTGTSGPGFQNILFFKVGTNLSYSDCLISQSPTLSTPSLTRTDFSWSANEWSPTVTDLNLTPTNPSVSTSNFCAPVYEDVNESPTSRSQLFCSATSEGLIFVSAFNAELNLYSPDGRLVYSGLLQKGENRITLGQGVYLWRAGDYKGKAVVR